MANAPPRTLLRVSLFALGFSAVLTQLTLMRELLCIYLGNELVFGVILGNWLLLTGLGAFGGRTAARLKDPLRFLAVGQLGLALLPLAALFVLRVFRHYFFLRGATVEMTETVLSSLLLLLPYCVLSGFLLTLGCTQLAAADDASGVGRSYFWDSAGSVAGGVLFSFALVPWLDHFGILYVPAFVQLLLAAATALLLKRNVLFAAALAVTGALLAVVFTMDLDRWTTEAQYPNQRVLFRGHSPYGRLVVTEMAGQRNFIENGIALFARGDPAAKEETVHYAMLQRPAAQRVLLISGGASGTAREVLKYGVRQVDYVELDPLIVEAAREFFPESLRDPRIHVIQEDGRRFVKEVRGRYDVIIVDLPDPSTAQLNRYYTAEFFAAAHRALTADGVLSLGLAHFEEYVSPELRRLIATPYWTLKPVFGHVEVLPGADPVLFLASDGALTLDLAPRLEARGIRTLLFNRAFLRETLTKERLEDLRMAVRDPAEPNTDFDPVLYYYHLLYKLTEFEGRAGVLAGVLLVLTVLFLWRIRAVPYAVFSVGFSASALQVVLLLGFQILHGYLYQQLGLLTAAFMAGLALGAGAMLRSLPRRRRRDLAWLQVGLAVFAVCVPPVLRGLGHAGGAWAAGLSAYGAFPLLMVLLAAAVGLAFPLAGKVDFTGLAATASRLYLADFAGACLGALLVSTLLIPILGVTSVCLLIAGLNLLGALVVWRGKG